MTGRFSPHGLRIAAIDIGTNSLHMVIVEVTATMGFKVLSSEKELTQLGSESLVRHILPRQAMNHTLSVLSRYMRVAHSLECDRILAFATSAVRESINGGDFVLLAKTQLGLDIRVISSQEEARLIYLAVRQAVGMEDGPALIIDIGGGSAELIVGTPEKALLLESRKLGASRLTQQYIHHHGRTSCIKNFLRFSRSTFPNFLPATSIASMAAPATGGNNSRFIFARGASEPMAVNIS